MSSKTIYYCDICGDKKNNAPEGISGDSKLIFEYTIGSRGYDGAWGGATIKIEKKDICYNCTVKIKKFMDELIGRSK